jgi:hypothetical protein
MFIAIGNRKRMGKDTFADMLSRHLYTKTKKMSCIQYARDMVSDLFPVLACAKDSDEKEHQYRDLIISIVDSCLKVNEKCFAVDLHNRYNLNKVSQNKTFIVPDLRRRCEMDFFREHLPNESVFILVENPRVEKVDSYGEGSIDDHYLWDYVVENNGSLEDLNNKAKMVARELNFGIKDSSPVFLS